MIFSSYVLCKISLHNNRSWLPSAVGMLQLDQRFN